jgi:putative oxidoreductase
MLLAVGAVTPFAAAVLVSVMLVAIVSVHLQHGFFVTGGGYEYPLVLAVSAATPAFTGPGRLSVDAGFGIHPAGTLWGLGALLVGILGATVQLASRGHTATAHTRA